MFRKLIDTLFPQATPPAPAISEQLAIDTLRERGTERGNRLADEIERGMERDGDRRSCRDLRETRDHLPRESSVDRRRRAEAAGSLHAHELSPDDAALLRALFDNGVEFGHKATITLPSGREVTSEEMRRWCGDFESGRGEQT